MNYQNWAPTVLTKKGKTDEKDLKRNALDNSSQGVLKSGQTTQDSRHIGKILNTESFDVPHMTVELRQAIIQARQKLDWKQKDLAMAIGVKEQVVSHYEAGKAVPENSIIAKMEQAMKCKLPRVPKH